jgi:transposase InsO family protein
VCIRGDLDGVKGVYLNNAVDEVTQFQVVFAGERISEVYLLPVLAAMMDALPFAILGFHSDNGSEYLNQKIAALREKLCIEQTNSCSRQTSDNALAESKNAPTVRKYPGFSHIPQHFASQVNAFYHLDFPDSFQRYLGFVLTAEILALGLIYNLLLFSQAAILIDCPEIGVHYTLPMSSNRSSYI